MYAALTPRDGWDHLLVQVLQQLCDCAQRLKLHKELIIYTLELCSLPHGLGASAASSAANSSIATLLAGASDKKGSIIKGAAAAAGGGGGAAARASSPLLMDGDTGTPCHHVGILVHAVYDLPLMPRPATSDAVHQTIRPYSSCVSKDSVIVRNCTAYVRLCFVWFNYAHRFTKIASRWQS